MGQLSEPLQDPKRRLMGSPVVTRTGIGGGSQAHALAGAGAARVSSSHRKRLPKWDRGRAGKKAVPTRPAS